MAAEQEFRNAAGMTNVLATKGLSQLRSTIISDEVRQWVKEGRVFQAGEGVLTTEATIAAADLVRQQPQMLVRVPAGIVIVPLLAIWVPQATTAISQMLVSVVNNDPGVSNMTATTPVNVNTRFSTVGSQVTCYGTNAGNTGTAPTGVADLYREYHQADRDAITGAPTPPLVYNPRDGHGQEAVIGNNSTTQAWTVYGVSGTTGTNTAFFIITWAEFTYADYYGS